MTRAQTMSVDLGPATAPGVIGPILAWVGAGFAWLFSWRIANAKREGSDETEQRHAAEMHATLRQDLKDIREDLKVWLQESRTIETTRSRREGEQDATNRMTLQTLAGLAKRLDEHENRMNAQENNLGVLTQLLARRAADTGKDGSL